VHTTAELIVGELPDLEFHRAPDAETGYLELASATESRPLKSGWTPALREGQAGCSRWAVLSARRLASSTS
jgi:hypothetical protein